MRVDFQALVNLEGEHRLDCPLALPSGLLLFPGILSCKFQEAHFGLALPATKDVSLSHSGVRCQVTLLSDDDTHSFIEIWSRKKVAVGPFVLPSPSLPVD